MVNSLTINDLDRFNELGKCIKSNFSEVFKLNEILLMDYNLVFGFYDNNKLIAFIHIIKMYESVDIVNIVVDKFYRHQGIATRLINYVIDSFDDVESIILEVNENNKIAVECYRNNNFYEINRRHKYYGDEDAIIMKRDV